MKKFAFFLAPLMAISFLTNCGGKTDPTPGVKEYTVTFNSNGGSEVPSQTVKEGEKASKPTDPTKIREGYTCSFLHWESDNKEFEFNTPIDKDITLYAKWKEDINIYTVTFDVDGDKEKIEPQHIAHGNCATKPTPSPTKETDDLIYEVDYWELNGTKFSFNTPITDNITLKAKWSENGEIKASWEDLAEDEAPKYKVGDYKYLTINNQPHKVRIIGTKHDNLVDEAGEQTGEKANYTFEFADLLSDRNGYSLATLWKRGNLQSYADYFSSDLRKAVDGESTGSLYWFTKGAEEPSTEYTTSALGMLPDELTPYLKTVQKSVRIYERDRTQHFSSYNTELFLLTHDEMDINSIAAGGEGEIYSYYMNNNTNSARIKHQVKWHEGAASKCSTVIDYHHFDHNLENFAGFNHQKEENGGLYWLVSPSHDNMSCSWRTHYDGSLSADGYNISKYIFGIAPAFCI